MYLNEQNRFEFARLKLLRKLYEEHGITDRRVLGAIEQVPRQIFISEALRYRSYEDTSLPIGFSQTISRPSTVARMLQECDFNGHERVLEIGSGSGYQTALLSMLAGEVFAMERIEDLFLRARDILVFKLVLRNIHLLHTGDFNEINTDFDVIIVAAGAESLPVNLLTKLRVGGRLLIPVQEKRGQRIKKYVKQSDGSVREYCIAPAEFVPLIMPEKEVRV